MMKFKRPIAFFLMLLMCLSCVSCQNADIAQTSDVSLQSDPLDSKKEEETPTLSPEDIVYSEEELPRVYISTENNFQVTSKKEYSECIFRLENNGRFEEYSSSYTDADGASALIRARGNATYNNPEMKAKNKYSYKVKLDEKANILGMGESRHWYLINNWRDTSNLRHKLAYDLAAVLGVAHTDSQWVVVYYNGEYRGLYLLCESIRVAEDRVETFNWEEYAEDIADAYAEDNGFSVEETMNLEEMMKEDIGWITTRYFDYTAPNGQKKRLDLSLYFDPKDLDFTSGYLIEYCTGMDTDGTKWKTEHGIPVVMDNPYDLETNPMMYSYVKTLIQDFENALFSPTFYNEKGKHYSEYLDVESLVNYWTIWNFYCNNEFGSRSLYYYIDGGKITFGPIWDFDQTIGNVTTVTTSASKGDYFIHDRKDGWFKEIFGDPWFTSLCQEKWFSMREVIDDLISSVDIYFDYMGEEAEKCYERNGIRYYTIRQPDANDGHSLTPTEDHELIRTWLRNRVKWLDENFSKIDPNVDGGGYTRGEKVFANITYNGKELSPDLLTVYGVKADYIISPEAVGSIKLSVSTTHTHCETVGVYLNGSIFLGNVPMSITKGAEYNIDISSLDMEDGDVNVLYILAYRADGTVRAVSSVVIKVNATENPTNDQCVIWFGDTVFVVDKGSVITIPEIDYEREGFVACGWTVGSDTVHKPGDEMKVVANASYYVRWKRTDVFSAMSFY